MIAMLRDVHGNLSVEIAGTNVVSDKASVKEMPPIAINLKTENDAVSRKGFIINIVAVMCSYIKSLQQLVVSSQFQS